MPAGSPFTRLCQALARPSTHDRADLHLHSTHSDGLYSPAQLVELARRSGLMAIALTDHDTLSGVTDLRRAADGSGVEIIAGVEISCEEDGQELHLLGYFVCEDHTELLAALDELRQARRSRFLEMADRLRVQGVKLDLGNVSAEPTALGRRHLAELLVAQRKVSTVREAFQRYLGNSGRVAIPKRCLPVVDAIELVRCAGGVAAWAHPSDRDTWERLVRLRDQGLGAVEAEYPTHRPSRVSWLRQAAASLGLAISGGSDCHGPGEPRRAPGACSITATDLATLRQR